VNRPYLPDFDEFIRTVGPIWDSHYLTNNGPMHQQFEEALSHFMSNPNLVLTVNGHIALDMAIKAFDLKGSVITTPFTFSSTTQAILSNGLRPIFADVEREHYNIDPNKIEDLIAPDTSAILAVHVFGSPCRMDEIQRIADRYGLRVIYDAAHAIGVRVSGVDISHHGDASMFSLHATKVINSVEGGVLTFFDGTMKKRLESIKNFGLDEKNDAPFVGTNGKMNEFSAAMGLINLSHFDEIIKRRKSLVERYRKHLSGNRFTQITAEIEGVRSNYSYFSILLKNPPVDRDALFLKLLEKGIETKKYFHPLCSDFSAVRNRFETQPVPVARHISENILQLPLYYDLELEDVDAICDSIKMIMGS